MSTVKWIIIAIVGLALIGLVIDYVRTKGENGELKGQLQAWETKYSQAVIAQTKSEQENAKLREDKEALDQSLIKWRNDYSAISQASTAAQQQIRRLQNENAKIRTVLNSAVDDDIWSLLFQRPDARPDADSDAKRD